VAGGLLGQARAQALAHGAQAGGGVGGVQAREHRERGGHGRAGIPEGAGEKDPRGGLAQALGPRHGGERPAIGDGLGPGGEVGAHAQPLPAAAQVEPEARAHVVEDQGRAGRVADRAAGGGEFGGRRLLRAAEIVAEGGDHDAGEVLARRGGGLAQADDVVELEMGEVGAVGLRHPGGGGGAPGRGAVIGAAGGQDHAPAGGGAGDGGAGGGGVGAVLEEQRPVGGGDRLHQPLGQRDGEVGRAVEAVALVDAGEGGGVGLRVGVAEDDGAPGAHEVDVVAPVGVGDARAAAGAEELGVALGQAGGAHVAPHAAGDHPLGPGAQAGVGVAFVHGPSPARPPRQALRPPRRLSGRGRAGAVNRRSSGP
jgi:hypothetical protein